SAGSDGAPGSKLPFDGFEGLAGKAGEQDMPAVETRCRGSVGRHRIEVDVEVEPDHRRESRALPELTLHAQGPMHPRAEPACYRETQPGAAVAPGERHVDLVEGVEDPRVILGRDADAGVG